MKLLQFVRSITGRDSISKRPKSNAYTALITISLEGVPVRKIELLLRANNRNEAKRMADLKIASDITVESKVSRAKTRKV